MPNIAITNYCNLTCPYCFANDFIITKKHNITLDELQDILFFLKKGTHEKYRIGIIGGEPTLHPKFDIILSKIIDFSTEQKILKPTVFSNGILLDDYSFFFANDASVLLNLNSPDTIGQEKWNKIKNTLNSLDKNQAFAHHNVHLGINLYLGMPNWSYIFEIAKCYNQKEIRCSVVAPACNLKTNNKFIYYEQNKELFLNFLLDIEKNNIIAAMDCNRIPLCYFSDKEKDFILKNTKRYEIFCDKPVIDIKPDMTAINCFGTGISVDMKQFKDLTNLERYFQFKHISPLIEKQKIGKCQNCEKIEKLECQGGCFSFVK